MKDPRIQLKSRELAAVLAFLIPGAGHFYQGRNFKAGIYFTGILFLFFGGMILGDWQPVYSQIAHPTRAGSVQMQPREAPPATTWSIGYAAQALVGLPAMPALIQQGRFVSGEGAENGLYEPVQSHFSGMMNTGETWMPVTGTLTLNQGELGSAVGELKGETQNGVPASLSIEGSVSIGRPVFGSPLRQIIVSGNLMNESTGTQVLELRGHIRRPFLNWYQAPRDNAELDRLHGSLSQKFDIACVFTWIAGLLNLMAIWDAYDGPGYGYGDEEPEEDDKSA